MKLGLISGRHSMPVDKYILPENITTMVGYDQGLYNAAFNASIEATLYDNTVVELYITGLTIAALGAIQGLEALNRRYIIYTYDKESNTYVAVYPLEIK